jgi:hypothetical protein
MVWQYHNYIVEFLTIWRQENARCITYKERTMITTKDGMKFSIPCSSPFCPKHAIINRNNWVNRIVYECSKHQYNYMVSLPLLKFIEQEEMTKIWKAYRAALWYELPPIKFCFAIEIQNDIPHMHGFIHCHRSIDTVKVKVAWKKVIAKYLKVDVDNLRADVVGVYEPIGAAKYVMKTNGDKQIQLPPRGWLYRIVKASSFYGRVGRAEKDERLDL